MLPQRGQAGQDTQTVCQGWGQECLQGSGPLPEQLWGGGLIGSTLKLLTPRGGPTAWRNLPRQAHSVSVAERSLSPGFSVSPDFLISPVGTGASAGLGDCSKPPGPPVPGPTGISRTHKPSWFPDPCWKKRALSLIPARNASKPNPLLQPQE